MGEVKCDGSVWGRARGERVAASLWGGGKRWRVLRGVRTLKSSSVLANRKKRRRRAQNILRLPRPSRPKSRKSVFVLLALLFCWFCLCGGPLSCHGCSNPSSWCGVSQARPSCRRVLFVWPKLWRRITQGSRAGVCVQSCRPQLLTPRVPVQIHQKSCKALWVKRENLKPRVRGVCMVWAATHVPFTWL